MSQHDLNIANQTRTNFRQDLNSALEAIASKQSGSGDPTITYPYQEKIDTSASPAVVYIRKSSNDAWVRIGYVDATTGQLIMDDATDAVNAENADTVDGKHISDIQNGSLVYCAVAGTDTYTGTLSPAITAYTQGMKVLGKVANANTSTAPTLNLNSIGAKKIFKEGGYSLATGDIPAGHHALFSYDSTLDSGSGGWLMINPKAQSGKISGDIVKIVSAIKTNVFTLSSSTFTDVTDLSVNITPENINNTTIVSVSLGKVSISPTRSIAFRLMRDSTPIGVATEAGNRISATFTYAGFSTQHDYGVSFILPDSPGTTSQITYKLQMATQDGTTGYIGRSVEDTNDTAIYHARAAASIIVMEVKG